MHQEAKRDVYVLEGKCIMSLAVMPAWVGEQENLLDMINIQLTHVASQWWKTQNQKRTHSLKVIVLSLSFQTCMFYFAEEHKRMVFTLLFSIESEQGKKSQ